MQQAKEQVVIRFVETITLWPFDTQLCLVSFSRATMLLPADGRKRGENCASPRSKYCHDLAYVFLITDADEIKNRK